MRVRLTRSMVRFIDQLVAEPVRDELSAQRVFSGDRTVDIDAAYIAWELARDAMAGWIFKPNGTKQTNVPYTAAHALQRVATATNARMKHAALRDCAMIGYHGVTFPVWELPEPDEHGRRWWPAPIEGCRFAVLKPTWHTDRGRLTTWDEHGVGPDHDRLYDEAVHWRVLHG